MDIGEEEAESRKYYGQTRRPTGGPSGTKVNPTEVVAIRNKAYKAEAPQDETRMGR